VAASPGISDRVADLRAREGPVVGDLTSPFQLAIQVSAPASATEIQQADASTRIPQQLRQLWELARESRLFVDVDYGQWGLHLLSQTDCVERTLEQRELRPDDMDEGVLVIGEFLGDLDLLVIAGASDGTRVEVALPLDPRAEWWVVADDLAEFLGRFVDAGGEKYWERRDAQ
jgi:hypothetical protein